MSSYQNLSLREDSSHFAVCLLELHFSRLFARPSNPSNRMELQAMREVLSR